VVSYLGKVVKAMEFKDRIKYLIDKRDMPVAQLALDFGKTESAVRSWILGRTKPDADTLINLAKYFNCSTDYLLGICEYINIGDFQSAIQRSDELTQNIEKLPVEDAKNFILGLNTCLEVIASSPLICKTDDNEIFSYWTEILNAFVIMCGSADTLYDLLHRHSIAKGGDGILVAFDISSLVTFIKSKENFRVSVDSMYREFSHMILDNMQDDEKQRVIRDMLLL